LLKYPQNWSFGLVDIETTFSCGGYVVSKSHLGHLEILLDRFSKTFKNTTMLLNMGNGIFFQCNQTNVRHKWDLHVMETYILGQIYAPNI